MSDSGDWWLNGMEHRMESHLENKADWDVAYGWGDHSLAGYLSSFIEADPIFLAWDKSTGINITESQISDLQSYLTSYSETDPVFLAWDKSTGISITESQISDIHSRYIDAEAVAAIKADADWDASNWDIAFGWGNHSGLYDALGIAAGLISIHEINYNHVNYDTAYTHSQNNSQAHLDYLKNNADDSTTGKLTAAEFISTILQSAAGPLKIQANANDDVVLFSSADVSDVDDGKELKIWRNASEGNNYIRTYITSTQNALIHSNTSIILQNASGSNIQFNSGQHIYLNLGDQTGDDEVRIRNSAGVGITTIDSDGNAWFAGDFTLAGAVVNRLHVQGSEAAGSLNAALEIENIAAGGDRWFFRAGATGAATPAGAFSIADTAAYRFIIDEDGNVGVGIGVNIPAAKLEVGGSIVLSGTVDGRDVATDGDKLDGIESNAEANQTGAEIKIAYEAEANAYTDTKNTKLAGIAIGAEVATKEFFISAGAAILSSNASYDTPNNTYQLSLADAVTFARCFFVFHLPNDFTSMVSGYPKVVFQQGTGGTGNYRIAFNGRAGGAGESLGGVLDNIAEYTMAGPGNTNLWEEDISANFDELSLIAGDYVGLQIQRDSDDSLDTFVGDLDVLGVVVKYS